MRARRARRRVGDGETSRGSPPTSGAATSRAAETRRGARGRRRRAPTRARLPAPASSEIPAAPRRLPSRGHGAKIQRRVPSRDVVGVIQSASLRPPDPRLPVVVDLREFDSHRLLAASGILVQRLFDRRLMLYRTNVSLVPYSTESVVHSRTGPPATRISLGARVLRRNPAAIRALCQNFPERVLAEARRRAALPRGVRRRADHRRLDGRAHSAASTAAPASGLAEASVIMEEINRSGAQLRRVPRAALQHGHAAAPRIGGAEARVPAAHRARRAAPAIDGRHRTDDRHRHDQDEDDRGASAAIATS